MPRLSRRVLAAALALLAIMTVPAPAQDAPQEVFGETEPPSVAMPGIADPVLKGLGERYDAAAAKQDETGTHALPTPRSTAVAYLPVFAALAGLCGAIILLGWLSRRFLGRTPVMAGARLGTVLGRVYLSPRSTLVYVKSGDRVLLIGQTPAQLTLLAEFPAAEFEEESKAAPVAAPAATERRPFAAELRNAAERMERPAAPDEDLESLRGEIQRLQRFMQESARELRE
jgi:flagellar biogenesis protein FliO